MKEKDVILLAIESSCDDTSVAVTKGRELLSLATSSQTVHERYGGVIPEAASRAHLQNIVPTVSVALNDAGVRLSDLSAIAVTRGPGLMGSLLVGVSFAKGLAQGLNLPLIEVNHLQAHVMANFVTERGIEKAHPSFPFLCLLVSGGNSQIIIVHDEKHMELIGATIDDAAGEAMDKCAKVMGLPYPGGPQIDRRAKQGNDRAFDFARPKVPNLDYSFSGLKTSFLYTLRDALKVDADFVKHHETDLCASVQRAIVDILMDKFEKAVEMHPEVQDIALAGGVSANSALRERFERFAHEKELRCFIPPLKYTTDNAAMVAAAAWWKYERGEFCPLDAAPYARVEI